MSDSELNSLFEFFSTNGSCAAETIYKTFEELNLVNISKELKVQKEDVMLNMIEEWENETEKQVVNNLDVRKIKSLTT